MQRTVWQFKPLHRIKKSFHTLDFRRQDPKGALFPVSDEFSGIPADLIAFDSRQFCSSSKRHRPRNGSPPALNRRRIKKTKFMTLRNREKTVMIETDS